MNRKTLWSICSIVLILLSVVSVFLGSRSLTHAAAGQSTWWNRTYPETQQYGCTSFPFEIPAYRLGKSCPPSAPYFHTGIDIGMPCNTPLYAPVAVTVISVGGPYGRQGYGFGSYYPRLQLPDGHYVILGHVMPTVVSPGQQLNPGDLIAYSNTQGNSTGCHLHFEVDTGTPVTTSIDPRPFLNLTSSVPPSPVPPPPFNPRFVTNLYNDVLGREGNSSDVQKWVQALNHGSSLGQVANSFLTSSEYRTKLVAADYQQILHRAADAGGSAFYVGQLNNGAKNEDVLVSLAASDDYFANRGGGTNSGFVSALYQDLFQRAADPSGLAFWTQQLNNGVSRGTVAQGLVASTEYRTKLVEGYYSHYLARSADPGGESYYVSALNNGVTDEDVIVSLAASYEYYAKPSWLSVRYVTNLYHDIMNRTASQVDVNWWAQALDHGSSRGQVANSFLTSLEYRTKLVAADYQQILHRPADASGSAFFVGQLNNGAKNEDVLVGLAASDEYFANRGGGTNDGFVNALYQDLLQRAADPSGLAFWTQQLANGVSRGDVARGLAMSTERYTKLVDGYFPHYLGRAADPSGENYYVSILNNGGTDESVIAGLAASDEYYAKPQA